MLGTTSQIMLLFSLHTLFAQREKVLLSECKNMWKQYSNKRADLEIMKGGSKWEETVFSCEGCSEDILKFWFTDMSSGGLSM